MKSRTTFPLALTISVLLAACSSSSSSGGSSPENLISANDAPAVSEALEVKVNGSDATRVASDLPPATTTGNEPIISGLLDKIDVANGEKAILSADFSASSALAAILIKVVGANDHLLVNLTSTTKVDGPLTLEFDIPENITDGEFCVQLAAQDDEQRISAPVEFCFSVESSADDPDPAASSAIDLDYLVGGWVLTVPDGSASAAIIHFFSDSTYVFAIDHDDPNCLDGVEWGTFNFNAGDQTLSPTAAFVDTTGPDGDCGLIESDRGANLQLSRNGLNRMTAANQEDGESFALSLTRLPQGPGFAGSWLVPGTGNGTSPEDGPVILTLLGSMNGQFVASVAKSFIEDGVASGGGMEFGIFEVDSTGNALLAHSIDTANNAGFDGGDFTLRIGANDTLEVIETDSPNPIVLTRVPQNFSGVLPPVGPTTASGSAADCHNPLRGTPGNTYQTISVQTDTFNGQSFTERKSDTYTVGDFVTFDGRPAVEIHVFEENGEGATANSFNSREYFGGDGSVPEARLLGQVEDHQNGSLREIFRPGVLLRFNLDPGQNYFQSYDAIEEEVAADGTVLSSSTTPESLTITYVGRRIINVPAGSFNSCHFQLDFMETAPDGLTSTGIENIYVGVGNGIEILQEGSFSYSDGSTESYRIELHEATINGNPI